jgi:ABC-type molybdate transport system substrate-binding protein
MTALTNLGWWSRIEPKLVETEDVRATLNFVARGECQVGILLVSPVQTFPVNTLFGSVVLSSFMFNDCPFGVINTKLLLI